MTPVVAGLEWFGNICSLLNSSGLDIKRCCSDTEGKSGQDENDEFHTGWLGWIELGTEVVKRRRDKILYVQRDRCDGPCIMRGSPESSPGS